MVQGYESEATGDCVVGNVNLVGHLVGERQRRASDRRRGPGVELRLRRATLQMRLHLEVIPGRIDPGLAGLLKRGRELLAVFVAVRVIHFVDLGVDRRSPGKGESAR